MTRAIGPILLLLVTAGRPGLGDLESAHNYFDNQAAKNTHQRAREEDFRLALSCQLGIC